MTFEELLQAAPVDQTAFSRLSPVDKRVADLLALLGARISQEREKQGISQSELGKRLHVTQAMVSRWENADTNMTIRKMVEIFTELGVEADIVIDGRTITSKQDLSSNSWRFASQNRGSMKPDVRSISKRGYDFGIAAAV